jgi:transcriptional regulator with XRE-family HTH domain
LQNTHYWFLIESARSIYQCDMANDFQQRFCKLLISARKRAGLTQQKLADDANLSVEMVNRIENARATPSFETIEKLATALKVDPGVFYFPNAGLQNDKMTEITVRLAQLTDNELAWVDRVLAAMLDRRP